jgi:hypothetical protein
MVGAFASATAFKLVWRIWLGCATCETRHSKT